MHPLSLWAWSAKIWYGYTKFFSPRVGVRGNDQMNCFAARVMTASRLHDYLHDLRAQEWYAKGNST